MYIKSFLLLPVIFLLSCRHNEKRDVLISGKEFKIPSEKVIEYDIQTLKLTDAKSLNRIVLKGQFIEVPDNIYQITFPFPGTIRKIYKSIGVKVTKGTILAEVENPFYLELKSAYVSKKNELEYLKQNFQRQGELAMEQATSIKKLEEAQKYYLVTEVEVKTLEEKLKLLGLNPDEINIENLNSTGYIISPSAGTIINVNAQLGSYFSEKDELFELSINNKISCRFNLQMPYLFDQEQKSQQNIAFTRDSPHLSASISNVKRSDSLVLLEIELAELANMDQINDVWAEFKLKPGYLAIPGIWTIENKYLLVKTGQKTFKALKLNITTIIDEYIIIPEKELDKKEEIVIKNIQNLIQLSS